MIGTIARFLGLDTLLVYAIMALLAGGGIWAWSAHKYSQGYSAGSAHERQAWIDQREEDKAKQLAKAAADQRKINQIEADYLAAQGQLAEAQAALEEAIHAEGAD
ncbi:hypothetical protein LB579_31845, partial [Mesorhizobium sp. BR1-1-7]|uniref:hypothetical protein n=1 Tax=Mesorhizobium sp. BR1-1-7 TaxID=2876647 RepID=UPI001CCA1145